MEGSTHQSFLFLLRLFHFLTIIVGHRDDRKYEIDQIEGSHEYHDYKENDMIRTVCSQDL